MAAEPALKAVALSGDLAAFEAAWLEALSSPRPAAEYLAALAAVPDGLRGSSAVSLLLLLLESAEKRGRHADVVEVVRALHPYRQQKVDLGVTLSRALAGLHGNEPWFALFSELAGFGKPRGDLLDALDRYGQLTRLVPGAVVYHRSGWAEGLVTSHDLPQRGFLVEFRRDGQTRFMPFTTGLDVLNVLDPDDLRARLLVDLEGLKRQADEQPELLVRSVARLHKGRATVKELKTWLEGPVIEARSWASWWRKAKGAAARDPFLAVENPSRPVFVLRQRAVGSADVLAGAIQRAKDLAGVLSVMRGPLSMDPSPETLALALAELRTRLGTDRDHAARAEAALLLCRHGGEPPEFAAPVVDAAATALGGFASLAGELPDATARREAFSAFVAARPQLWSAALVPELGELPPQLLDTVCDKLLAEGRAEALVSRFKIFLLNPSRAPAAVLRLAKRWAEGRIDKIEGAPLLHDVTMGLLHLAETQAPLAARGDKPAKEVMRLLDEQLLTGKSALLPRFVKAGSRGELGAALGVLKRCRQMPDEIVAGLRKPVQERFPDLAPVEELPFWEGGAIFCSREGLARRREEYRVLMHEKIPANSEDIGRAASYGDLSENFEWTAAIEQQRQLTEKAATIEAELKLAQAIEDQKLPPGVVAPGTRVTFEQDGQSAQTVRILGPWDVGPDVMSYRAPLAAGMLGAKAGETVQVTLPAGVATVRVVAIEPVAK